MYKSFIIMEEELNYLLNKESSCRDFIKKSYKLKIVNKLANYIFDFFDAPSIIDANKIIDLCFPNQDFPIFLSHSGKDIKLVHKFSNWVYNNFGIQCFIDSDVWACIKDVQKIIDKRLCYKEYTATYDYNSRNYTTANIHMMLAHALTYQIQKSEAFIFIASDNSLAPDSFKPETFSPWIYHELTIANCIATVVPQRLTTFSESVNDSFEENPIQFKYNVNLDKFIILNRIQLKSWLDKSMYNNFNGIENLNLLYEITDKDKIKYLRK